MIEIKTGISLQTKQALSQMQVESLNILAMSMTELKDFLQKEEIENPLLEFSAERGEEAAPVTYKETERFYNGTERENSRENELYEIEDSEKSIEDLVNMQLHWKKISETDRKIVDFCVQSIEQSGYFLIPVPEIAKRLNVPEEQAGEGLSLLKERGAQGVFSSGLGGRLSVLGLGGGEGGSLSGIIKNNLFNNARGKG